MNFRYTYAGVAAVLLVTFSAASCSYFAPRRTLDGAEVREERVLFRFYAPTALQVQLAGDWPENNWARGDGSVGEANIGIMDDADGDGIWEIEVTLPPGRYCYLFRVDETTWHLDPANPEEVPGGPARRCSQLVVVRGTRGLELK